MTDVTKMTTAQEAYDYLGVTADQVRAYFGRVEKVMHRIIEVYGCDPAWAKRYWMSGVNPFYSQLNITAKKGLGLGLVEYYGAPHRLATPFGGITFTGASGNDDWFRPLRPLLGLKPLWGEGLGDLSDNEAITHDMFGGVDEADGTFGPVWEISKDLDGLAFDEAHFSPSYVGIPDMSHAVAFPYDVAKLVWAECAPEGFKNARLEMDHSSEPQTGEEPAMAI